MTVTQGDNTKQGQGDGRVGVSMIGTGRIENLHAGTFKTNLHAEIVGFAEIIEGVPEKFSGRHGVDTPSCPLQRTTSMDARDTAFRRGGKGTATLVSGLGYSYSFPVVCRIGS